MPDVEMPEFSGNCFTAASEPVIFFCVQVAPFLSAFVQRTMTSSVLCNCNTLLGKSYMQLHHTNHRNMVLVWDITLCSVAPQFLKQWGVWSGIACTLALCTTSFQLAIAVPRVSVLLQGEY